MSDFTSCLRYPRVQSFVQIHDWQLSACGGNRTAAALLSVFEYKHNKILEDREFVAEVRETARAAGLALPPDFKFWFAFTDEELFRRVKVCKDKKTLYSAIELLKQKGFVATDPPAALTSFMKTGRRKWFRFLAHKIQPVIDEFDVKLWGKREEPQAKEPEAAPEKTAELFAIAREVFQDWREIISPRSLDADEKRLKPVVALLKKGATKERLQLAARGVLLLPYNTGANDDGRWHVGFDLIFRDADHFEKYERAALDAGLTVENFKNYVITKQDLRLRKAEDVQAEKAAPKPAPKPNSFAGESKPETYKRIAELIADGVSFLQPQDEILNTVAAALAPEDFFLRERLIEAVRLAASIRTPLDKNGAAKVEKIVAALIELQTGL